MPRNRADFLPGTLESLILKTLTRRPMHGYAVARWIEDVTDRALAVEEGSLYPALYRKEARLDRRRVGHIGARATGEVLSPDAQGAATTPE